MYDIGGWKILECAGILTAISVWSLPPIFKEKSLGFGYPSSCGNYHLETSHKHGMPNYIISVLFGIGKSTVYEVLHDTCAVVASHIMPKYVHIPNMAMLRMIVNGFEHNLGFPQAIGVIDGSHIAIIKPH